VLQASSNSPVITSGGTSILARKIGSAAIGPSAAWPVAMAAGRSMAAVVVVVNWRFPERHKCVASTAQFGAPPVSVDLDQAPQHIIDIHNAHPAMTNDP
jgi:hypothetical protein